MCQKHPPALTDTSSFADRMFEMLNGGATALMISIGHRTHLFDTLAKLKSTDSTELAEVAQLDERYVREWLGAMACAGIVHVDASGGIFHLPSEHASVLTRKSGADNFAPFFQYVSVLGSVESQVVSCFEKGGGVPYESYQRFHEVMAEDSGQSVVSHLFETILPLLSGFEEKLETGAEVLDLGCGQGRALLALARRFPRSHFLGIDLCEAPIEEARSSAKEQKLDNVQFEQGDGARLSYKERFDLITTFDAVHDQSRPDLVLKNIHGALKTKGTYLMQEVEASSNVAENLEHPMGALLYTISTMHCMTVSLAQGGLGLGAMWGRQRARLLLKEAGFHDIEEHCLSHDPQNRYYVMDK